MASGPAHFEEAERLLTVCAGAERGSELDKVCTAAAQVHATLALAAATALADYDTKWRGMPDEDAEMWAVVAGTKAPEPSGVDGLPDGGLGGCTT